MARIDDSRQARLLESYAEWHGTQKAFCARHQVPLSTLQSWLRRSRKTTQPAGFVEIRGDATVAIGDGAAMSVRFGRAELVLHDAPPAQWMADVIERLA